MKKITVFILAVLFCSSALAAKKSKIMKVPAGSNVPSLGMALDADYDASLDHLVPGYKILTVAIANNSIDIIQMNPEQDKWIVVDGRGTKHTAVINLRVEDNKTFTSLPAGLRKKLEYPLIVQVGDTKHIDLLLNDNVKLDGFRAVRYTVAGSNQTIEIVAQE